MIDLFELDWMGGAAESHFRRRRPLIDEMPWGTLNPRDFHPRLVAQARKSWTEGAYQEYCTAAAFTELLRALLEVRAPIDLVGMAGEFVADEMLHTELNARMAMELGGAAPLRVDYDALTPPQSPGVSPVQRANELAIRYCCVGETMSVPLLAGTMNATTHPLTRNVLRRIVQDEPAHARLGWLYLEWAADRIDAAERARLGEVALGALAAYAPFWQGRTTDVTDGVTADGHRLRDLHDLGWMESGAYGELARESVRSEIVAPLARFGIEVPAEPLESLLY